MSQNNPPFKVVCKHEVRPSEISFTAKLAGVVPKVKRGFIYTVKESFVHLDGTFYELIELPNELYEQSLFERLKSNYSDATAEILEKFKSPAETPDKVIVPEKVTNHL